ncbi:unnamed protein product [Rotaria sp. Silwood2]|nr:unnamed protein product [Rotaria sp. Silwood2]
MTPQPPPIFVIPGMRVACMPYTALVAATLECFFDPVCLNATAQQISILPPTIWPEALNSSIPSRFSRTSSISSLLEAQMVETWETQISFSNYYNACSPTECTYTRTNRGNVIYVITTLLGLFGGLLVALRIISPLSIQFLRYIQENYLKTKRRIPVQQPKLGIRIRIR